MWAERGVKLAAPPETGFTVNSPLLSQLSPSALKERESAPAAPKSYLGCRVAPLTELRTCSRKEPSTSKEFRFPLSYWLTSSSCRFVKAQPRRVKRGFAA